MTPMMQVLVTLLARGRFPLEDEKQTQNSILGALRFAQSDGRLARRCKIEREVRIAAGVIDFRVDDVGIEVKIKGQPAAIVRQIKGYAREETISGLILITSKPVPLCPTIIHGKPVAVVDMARAWL